jgi:hypothetical protein
MAHEANAPAARPSFWFDWRCAPHPLRFLGNRQHDDFSLEATGQLGKDDILTERGRRNKQQKRHEEPAAYFRRSYRLLRPRIVLPLCPAPGIMIFGGKRLW